MKIKEKIMTGLICLLAAFFFIPNAALAEEDKAMGDSYYDYPQEISDGAGFSGRLSSVVANPAKPSNTVATGVDLSHWEEEYVKDKNDMSVLKNSADFVILRLGYGQDYSSQDDKMLETYVKACRDLDIPYGVYLYSHASTAAEALGEANHALRLLKQCREEWGSDPALPVFLDMESSAQAKLSASVKTTVAKTFCEKLGSEGYVTGIYANTYWWNYYLTDSWFDSVIKWVAQYNDTLTYTGYCDIWQCSETAKIAGLSGVFDLNYMFTDLRNAQNLTKIDISQCTIGAVADQKYTGKQITPNVSVTYNGQTLKKNVNYTLSYSSNVKTGKAAITIKGIGRFSGTVKKYFVIIPKSTKISKIKSAKKAGIIYYKKVTGAYAYQIAIRKKGSVKWKCVVTKRLYKKITGLGRKKIYVVKVRPYVKVDGVRHFGSWSAQKKFKTK